MLQKIVVESDPILTEMSSILNDFDSLCKKRYKDTDSSKKQSTLHARDQRRKLNISFGSEREINELKTDQRFKLNARNTLGIKTKDDWIFNLNIGNVMQINCL